jgi:hypothetical protein
MATVTATRAAGGACQRGVRAGGSSASSGVHVRILSGYRSGSVTNTARRAAAAVLVDHREVERLPPLLESQGQVDQCADLVDRGPEDVLRHLAAAADLGAGYDLPTALAGVVARRSDMPVGREGLVDGIPGSLGLRIGIGSG